MNHSKSWKFLQSHLFSSDLGFETKSVFFAVLVDILPFGSGSVDPHISVDSDLYPGSQNLVDPMDSDP